jgi:opine dehydrogenase
MKITVIGAGNSGLAMAAHLIQNGHSVTLWNRTYEHFGILAKTRIIHSTGIVTGDFLVDVITSDMRIALIDPEIVFVTTPASSHRDIAEAIGKNAKTSSIIILNPGRTFGALEFHSIYSNNINPHNQVIAETQTIIYTCRKTSDDAVNIISIKSDVLISTFDVNENQNLIKKLPECIGRYLIPAKSMVETSIGNVGMILHCAPLLLNSGWTENAISNYKYYYDGITPSVARFIGKIDQERIEVSKALGHEVESTMEWMKRTYHIQGQNLFSTIQNNESYRTIDAPKSLNHRYIEEDVPCGLVPLESTGLALGIDMKCTSLIIDLANAMLDKDFRQSGRNYKLWLKYFSDKSF